MFNCQLFNAAEGFMQDNVQPYQAGQSICMPHTRRDFSSSSQHVVWLCACARFSAAAIVSCTRCWLKKQAAAAETCPDGASLQIFMMSASRLCFWGAVAGYCCRHVHLTVSAVPGA
jgi:hypothetical protein